MARARMEKERRAEELKLLPSEADGQVADLKGQLAASAAESPGSAPDRLADWKAIGQPGRPGSGLPPTLEQCKAAIRSLSDLERQQLVLWIARGMPKED